VIVVLQRMLGAKRSDVIPQALAFLEAECKFATVANEAKQHRQALVEMLCSLLQGAELLGLPQQRLPAAGAGADARAVAAEAKRLACTFAYALVWGLGGLLEGHSRLKFSGWVRRAGEAGWFGGSKSWVSFPRSGSVFDYYFDTLELTWKPWAEALREFRFLWGGNEDSGADTMFVPTQHNIALQHGMAQLYRAGHPVMLHGASGSGKTSIVADFLASLDPEQVICASVKLSGGTTPQQLQDALAVALEHKSGRLMAPLGTKRVAFFVDDLHLPPHDAYKAQPTLEILRHLLAHSSWFDLEQCAQRDVQNCKFVAATPPSRSWVTQARLRRRFACMHVEAPTSEELHFIYETVAVSMLRSFEPEVQRIAAPLAHSSVRVLLDLSSVLVATPERAHYYFNQHDLAKIFKGIQAHPDLCSSALSVAKLWLFITHATFVSRLVTHEDQHMCSRLIARALDSMHENLGSRDGVAEIRKAAFLFVAQQQAGARRAVLPCLVHTKAELRARICQYLNEEQPDALSSVGMHN